MCPRPLPRRAPPQPELTIAIYCAAPVGMLNDLSAHRRAAAPGRRRADAQAGGSAPPKEGRAPEPGGSPRQRGARRGMPRRGAARGYVRARGRRQGLDEILARVWARAGAARRAGARRHPLRGRDGAGRPDFSAGGGAAVAHTDAARRWALTWRLCATAVAGSRVRVEFGRDGRRRRRSRRRRGPSLHGRGRRRRGWRLVRPRRRAHRRARRPDCWRRRRGRARGAFPAGEASSTQSEPATPRRARRAEPCLRAGETRASGVARGGAASRGPRAAAGPARAARPRGGPVDAQPRVRRAAGPAADRRRGDWAAVPALALHCVARACPRLPAEVAPWAERVGADVVRWCGEAPPTCGPWPRRRSARWASPGAARGRGPRRSRTNSWGPRRGGRAARRDGARRRLRAARRRAGPRRAPPPRSRRSAARALGVRVARRGEPRARRRRGGGGGVRRGRGARPQRGVRRPVGGVPRESADLARRRRTRSAPDAGGARGRAGRRPRRAARAGPRPGRGGVLPDGRRPRRAAGRRRGRGRGACARAGASNGDARAVRSLRPARAAPAGAPRRRARLPGRVGRGPRARLAEHPRAPAEDAGP